MNERILAALANDMAATRIELEKLKTNPNLRTKIALESKLETLRDLHYRIRLGCFRDGRDLSCTVGDVPVSGKQKLKTLLDQVGNMPPDRMRDFGIDPLLWDECDDMLEKL